MTTVRSDTHKQYADSNEIARSSQISFCRALFLNLLGVIPNAATN